MNTSQKILIVLNVLKTKEENFYEIKNPTALK